MFAAVKDVIEEARQRLPHACIIIIWSSILVCFGGWYKEGKRVRKEVNAHARKVCKSTDGNNMVIFHNQIVRHDYCLF